MLTADGYGELVVYRLFEFFNRHAPWHLALWNVGTVLALEEVIEYSELTRTKAIRPEGLEYVRESALQAIADDPGVGPPEVADACTAALDPKQVATPAGVTTLAHLVDRICTNYLSRLATASRSPDRPGIEWLASAAASHLLDLGFSGMFLNEWLRGLVKNDPRDLDVADILDEANTLCQAAPSHFEVLVPFSAVPGGLDGPIPGNWLDASQAKQWLTEIDPAPDGDLRQSGAVVVGCDARDPGSAAEAAGELVAQVAARAAVAAPRGRLEAKGIAWVRGYSKPYELRPRTQIKLHSLKTAEDVFRLPGDPASDALNDALEIFSALEFGTRGAVLTGGWAAIEGLLVRPGEQGVIAADRLADVVACAFPRAEMTKLSYLHNPPDPDALSDALAGVDINLDRCRILEDSIKAGHPPTVATPPEQALLRRVESMIAEPHDKLSNVTRYVGDTFRRLYMQRNLVMHSGSFQSVSMRACLRQAPRLVAAGIDRLVAAQLAPGSADPFTVASRAKVELGLLNTPARRRLCDLLD